MHGGLDGLVGERLVPVLDEVAECWRVVVVEWLVERDRRLGGLEDALHLTWYEVEIVGDLLDTWLAAQLGAEPVLGARDAVQLLDDVDGHADCPRLVREGARGRLADPPGGVCRELEALAVIELLGGADEPDRALLDQIEGEAVPDLGSASRSRRPGADSPRPSAASPGGRRARSASRARPPRLRSAARSADLLQEQLQPVG